MLKKYLLLVTIIMLLCSNMGCWDLQEISEKTVTTSVGYDLEGNNRLRFSSLYIAPTLPGESSGVSQTKPVMTISSDYSGAMAARRTMLSLSKVPEYAHIRSIILGDNLVTHNLPLIVDLLVRNRNFSPTTSLMISAGCRPEDVLALSNNSDRILKQLVVVNELQLGIYVPVTIYDFIFNLLTPGIEPVVPQIMIETSNPDAGSSSQDLSVSAKNKKLVINGTAVFKKDKKVGYLTEYESRGFRWLNSHSKIGGIILIESPFHPRAYTVLEVLRFNSHTRALVKDDKIKMEIRVEARLAMNEDTSGIESITPGVQKKMHQAANQEIARQIKSCIGKSQRLNSDVMGWGLLLLQKEPDTWKQVKGKWDQIFPQVEYEVKVDTSIVHTYFSK
jgi:Ger(x)C family germination protein